MDGLVVDFTSALYLGMRHPSWSLRPWVQFTMGRPAALASTAGAGSSATHATAASQATSCKGTIKLAIITPLTGDAAEHREAVQPW